MMASDPTILEDEAHQNYMRNAPYTKPAASYATTLTPDEDKQFQAWVAKNKIPYDPSPEADYDMRGFWKGTQSGDHHAETAVNRNDGKLHFTDYWKTPYHRSFSAESKFAVPGKAPAWNDKDQLVTPDGKIVFDEPAFVAAQKAAEQKRGAK